MTNKLCRKKPGDKKIGAVVTEYQRFVSREARWWSAFITPPTVILLCRFLRLSLSHTLVSNLFLMEDIYKFFNTKPFLNETSQGRQRWLWFGKSSLRLHCFQFKYNQVMDGIKSAITGIEKCFILWKSKEQMKMCRRKKSDVTQRRLSVYCWMLINPCLEFHLEQL